jgi:hypothetical protein
MKEKFTIALVVIGLSILAYAGVSQREDGGVRNERPSPTSPASQILI